MRYPPKLGNDRTSRRWLTRPELVMCYASTAIDPAGASATRFKGATATVAAAVELLAANLSNQADLAVCPRQVRFTVAGGTPSDAPATATIYGQTAARGPTDEEVVETVALPQTATTVDTANFWTSIRKITYPPADGTGATVAIGITGALGLKAKFKQIAGQSVLIKELVDLAAPTAGTITLPATHKPFGSYTPDAGSAANGSKDFILIHPAEID